MLKCDIYLFLDRMVSLSTPGNNLNVYQGNNCKTSYVYNFFDQDQNGFKTRLDNTVLAFKVGKNLKVNKTVAYV